MSTALSVLICPSDTNPPVPVSIANADGNYFPGDSSAGKLASPAHQLRGDRRSFPLLELRPDTYTWQGQKTMLGVIYPLSSTSIAAITDGTSNTIMFAEVASSKAYPDSDMSGAFASISRLVVLGRPLRFPDRPPRGRPTQSESHGFPQRMDR